MKGTVHTREEGKEREGKKECVLCGDECECLWECPAYRTIRDDFLQNLQDCLGGSFSHFEAMNSLEKALFVLGSELWEEHLESLLALVCNNTQNAAVAPRPSTTHPLVYVIWSRSGRRENL